jgi:hypothetical protein
MAKPTAWREPKIFATKAQRHEVLFCYSFLVSWCLGGEKKKVLPQNAQNLQQAPKKAEGLL